MNISSLADAANWLQAILLGPLATTIAVIAISIVGFQMLTGRINWRHGAQTVIGCFILFGAPTIAAGIIDAARGERGEALQAEVIVPAAPQASAEAKRPQPICWTCGGNPDASTIKEPYAGASVVR